MKKILSLLALLMLCIVGANAEKVIYEWPSDATAANSVTLAEGVTVQITGNESKNIQSANKITIGEAQYTTMKVSNGAQNTLTLPKKATGITFYSYINKASNAENLRDSYWKEVAGVTYDAETSGGLMSCYSDGDKTNPDVRSYTFEATDVITFTNAGEQVCYVMEVEYADEVEPISTNKTIGLVPGPWDVDGATFAAYAWNDEGYAWFPFVEVSGAYGTQIPDTYTSIILTRINPSGTDPEPWNNVWNQTDNIDFTVIADQTVFTITGWGDGGNSTYTAAAAAPIDIDAVKTALTDAIQKAKDLNAYANDADLATAITDAETAVAGDDAAAIVDAAKALNAAAIKAAKDVLAKAVELANTFGINTSTAQDVLDKEDATVEDLATALTTLVSTAKPAAETMLATALTFFNTFDGNAAEALETYFAAAAAALEGTDISAMITAAQNLIAEATPAAKTAMEKVMEYFEVINDEPINTDVANLKAAMEANNLQGIFAAVDQLKIDFPAAADSFIKTVEFAAAGYKDAGKTIGIEQVEAAIANAKQALNAEDASIVTVGMAIRNLILTLQTYVEANNIYTIAGTKDLTGTEEDWQVVEANNMTLVDGLYTWTAENITVTAETQPQFKVVITDIDDKQTWIPASEEGNDHNWIITPEVVGGEGVYNITITYNAKTKNIGVTGEKVVVEGIIADGTYYIKNVATQKWLAAGADWGTHAVVNETGLDYVIKLADGKYTIDSQVSNGDSSNFLNGSAADGPWNDGGAYGWTVAEVSEGVFTISTGEKFITVGENDKLTFADEATEAAQWTLQTAADRDAANLATLDAATAENGVDATFFIKGADFNRNDLRNNAWTHTRNGGNETFAGPSENRQTYGCEYWNNTFEVSQTIEDLPEGYYTFSIAGFATNGTAKLFANETEADFTNTDAGGKNFREVLDAIAAGEFTGNTTEKVAVIGGTLKIGVKRTENKAADWTTFDNARLTYWGPIPANEFKPAYEEALAAAKDALENADYAAVTGDEKTALEQAIADNTEVDETADAYKAAILALETATSAFTGAKTAYESLAAAKAAMADFDFTAYKYATAEKKTAAETTLNAEATNAADATAKADAVYAAFRQYAESSAMLEGVEGAENFTDRIVNPKAEQTIAEPWVVESQSNNGNMGILSGEPWTDGEGNSTHKYFDGYAWGESAWDATMKQDVKLPKGKYQLTVKSRGSQDLSTFQLFAGEESVDMQHINATGGLFNRGWNDASIEFEVTEAGTVTIGVKGATETVHNWMSFSDFRLVRFETYEPVYTVVGGFDGEGDKDNVLFGKQWDATLESNDMGKGEGTVYTKTFEDIELEAGTTIYYKVVEDHSWNLASWGFNGGNADYVVNEAGKYNVTFTFNPEGLLPNNFNVDCSVVPAGGGDGISSIAAEAQKGNVYNLNGQKVTKAQKGLYIVNGRKQVVR